MSSATTTTMTLRESHLSLLDVVHNNLLNQADWKHLKLHTSDAFPRPLLTGQPPEPVYAEDFDQQEWVLPVDIREKWSLRKSAEVFDSLPEGFWGMEKAKLRAGNGEGETKSRGKRVLFAVCAEDSTVVYYVMHEGIVKPRQN